jgi:hypothetical protein
MKLTNTVARIVEPEVHHGRIVTNNHSIQGGVGTATESSGGGSVGINCYAQPLMTQLEHICRLVGGEGKTFVDGRDGARSLAP